MAKGLAIHTVHYNEPGSKVLSVALPGEVFETTDEQLASAIRLGAAERARGGSAPVEDKADDDAPKSKRGRPRKNPEPEASAPTDTQDGAADDATDTQDGAADDATDTQDGAADDATDTQDGAADDATDTQDGAADENILG